MKGNNHQNGQLPENFQSEDFQIEFTPSRRKTLSKVFVNINGNFTIANVSKVFNPVLSILGQYDQIDIRANQLSQFDLTAIQLLFYFKSHPEINIEVDIPLSHRQMFATSGLSEVFHRNLLDHQE